MDVSKCSSGSTVLKVSHIRMTGWCTHSESSTVGRYMIGRLKRVTKLAEKIFVFPARVFKAFRNTKVRSS